ncbi:MAG: alpha/beta fold hydrolase [Symploca sp. SIO2C1]|nr:alpha/beta fold hydrolase [Symploca sp. SIO2C1]
METSSTPKQDISINLFDRASPSEHQAPLSSWGNSKQKNVHHFRVNTQDGISLAAVMYNPPNNTLVKTGSPRVIVINCAMGRTKEKYQPFAQFMANQGWVVLTYDYRGIGQSKPEIIKGYQAELIDWGRIDTTAIVQWAHVHLNPSQLVIVGHSIGGQILGFMENCHLLNAAVLVGAQKGYWKYWGQLRRYGLWCFWKTFPLSVKLFNHYPLMRLAQCEPLPPGIALDWYRWGLTEEFTDRNHRSCDSLFARYTGPMLSISLGDDRVFAPKPSVDSLAAKYKSASLERWHIEPQELGVQAIGHSGFFDPSIGDKLLPRVLSWLDKFYEF